MARWYSRRRNAQQPSYVLLGVDIFDDEQHEDDDGRESDQQRHQRRQRHPPADQVVVLRDTTVATVVRAAAFSTNHTYFSFYEWIRVTLRMILTNCGHT